MIPDINLDELGPGPEWRRLTDREGEVWVHETEQRVLLIPKDGHPSHWGILSDPGPWS